MLEKITAEIAQKIFNHLSSFNLVARPGFAGDFSPSRRCGFIVSVTTRCNFRCPHCLRLEVDKKKTLIKDLPVSAFETVLRGGKKINFKFVSFTGGEPILHPQFAELVSLAVKYGYRFNFATNGWLHQEYLEIIKQHRQNLELIFLSLDGVTPEVHDANRNQPGSFARVIEAIDLYRKENIPIMVTFCLTKKNYHQIEKLPDFCLKLGVKSIKWANLIPVSGEFSAAEEKLLTANERAEALEKILNLREKFKSRCIFRITNSFCRPPRNLNSQDKAAGINICPILNCDTLYIDHDGVMFFCCDINRECKEKPLIQKVGFEESLKMTLDSANEMKKKFSGALLNNPKKINHICDFCNENIEDCLPHG